jgi:GrpB-like predicted nucleotidyltransferase (UPF0157 family)
LAGQIELVEYDLAWPRLFLREAQRIRLALGDRALRIEHTGSTSVPGLAAKPIVDIVLVVADSADELGYVPALADAGYILRIREPEWHQHRLLKPPAGNVHLHVFSADCPEVERMVLFRNHLRASEEDRRVYERTKRDLAGKPWKYMQEYADAKSAVIEEILSRAH